MDDLKKILFEFVSNNQDAMGYLDIAQRSFFEDVLDHHKLNSIEDIKLKFEDQFEMFYQCLLEYYCCNLYPHPDMDVFWNVLDEIQKSKKFNKVDTDFLNTLKNSSVSSSYLLIKTTGRSEYNSLSLPIFFNIGNLPRYNISHVL